jgi:DNA-binding MarR family transcriptional regulator
MVPRKEVSFAMRTLLNQMRRLSKPYLQHDGQVTPMQGRVIGFVSSHADRDVFQRDLERAFEIRRSTASAILQTMERDGLLTREPVPYDARLKKLVLTPRAVAFSDAFLREMARVEAIVTKGVSPEEMDAFYRIIGKFEDNLRACEEADACPPGDGRQGEEK